MYDHPAVRWATDALWSALTTALADRGVAAPAGLDRRADHTAAWRDPALVLSQTCGYPYAKALRGSVRLVATPRYRAPDCDGARYRSVLVVRGDEPARELGDLRGRRVAVNALDSQSGFNALRAAVAPLARAGHFFAARLVTGSHRASAEAVAGGGADLCAIDCVTWALLGRHEPELLTGLRVLGRSEAAPGLPLITGTAAPLTAVREAVQVVMASPALADVRAALLLDGVEILDDADYDAILAMERRAAVSGYPTLG